MEDSEHIEWGSSQKKAKRQNIVFWLYRGVLMQRLGH